MDLHKLYFEMRDCWEAIIRRPIRWDEKNCACLDLLVGLIDRMATERVGQANAPLRFYADMERLSRLLLGKYEREVDDIATRPARRIVVQWLAANALGNGGPVDIGHDLDWMQLRAIMAGEQPGWPALDPVRVRSNYVQAVLSRVIEQGSAPTEPTPNNDI